MRNKNSRNSIFEIDHRIDKPSYKMTLGESKKLDCSIGKIIPEAAKNTQSVDQYRENREIIKNTKNTKNTKNDSSQQDQNTFTVFLETEKNLIGIGQFASVYKGSFNTFLESLDNGSFQTQQVAVKVGKGGKLSIQKIKLEAEILKHLNHENIIKFVSLKEQNGLPVLVLEYLQYGNLNEWMDRFKKDLNKKLWIKWAKQISSALDYIHHYGIIHHDVNPANIMENS